MISLETDAFEPPAYLRSMARPGSATPDFPQQLAALRKQHSLTQQALAERIGENVVQLRRYETDGSEPTLNVIRKLVTALSVSADLLLFGKDERGPDDDLRLRFEAVSRFDAEEKQVVRSWLEGMILKHEARRWSSSGPAAKERQR